MMVMAFCVLEVVCGWLIIAYLFWWVVCCGSAWWFCLGVAGDWFCTFGLVACFATCFCVLLVVVRF